MSIDEKVQDNITNLRQKINKKDYGIFTLEGIVETATCHFFIPTRLRKSRSNRKHRRKYTFLESTIAKSLAFTVAPFAVGTTLMIPELRTAFVAGNAVSLVYETSRLCNKLFKKSDLIGSIKQIPNKFYHSVKEYIKSIPSRSLKVLKATPGWFGSYACSFAIASFIALTHYNATELLESRKEYNPKLVNLYAQEFRLGIEDKVYEFCMLGEVHLYNSSSSAFIIKLAKEAKLDYLLSEGVMQTQSQKLEGWRLYAEIMIREGRKPLAAGSGYDYPNPAGIFHQLKKPVIPLEKVSGKTKGREGLTDFTYLALGGLHSLCLIYAPAIYFMAAPLRYLPVSGLLDLSNVANQYGPNDLVHGRNVIMAERSLSIMLSHPEKKPMIRVGAAHVPGMKELISKYGELKPGKMYINFDMPVEN